MFKYTTLVVVMLLTSCVTTRANDPRVIQLENKCLLETEANADSAQNTCSLCLELHDKSLTCLITLGKVLFNIKEFDKATELFHKALEVNANLTVAHNNLGAIDYVLGNYNEAIVHYRKAVDIDPLYADARMGLALAYFRVSAATFDYATALENLTRSREQLQALVTIDPNYPGAQKALTQITEYIRQLS